MAATTLAPEQHAQKNLAADELILCVHGSPNDRRTVRLKSRKCTIGSGEHCTLRLRAAGVAPLHCLILRGRSGAVVRRWNPNTLLNDHAFSDAPLAAGDRLGIGPITIEVIGAGKLVQPPEENIRKEQDAARVELEAEKKQLDEQRVQWQAERDESQRALDEQRASLRAEVEELQSGRKSLDDQRREWENQQNENAARTRTQADQLQSQLADLNNERHALEEQRGQWQNEQQESRQSLETQLAELASQKADLDKQRDQLENERNDSVSLAKDRDEKHQSQLAEFEDQRRGFDEQKQQWQSEREEARRELEEQRAQVDSQRNEIDERRKALDDERRELENERKEGVSKAGDEADRLKTQLTDLESRQQALEDERRQWQSEREEAHRKLDEQRSQLDSQKDEIDAERATLEDERRQWQSEREEAQRRLDEQQAQLESHEAEPESEKEEESREPEDEVPALKHEPSPTSETEEPEFRSPGEKAPIDLNEIFNRLGVEVDSSKSEPDRATTEEHAASSAPSHDPRDKPVIDGGERANNVAAHDDEESIDDYMSRLMERVKASSGASSDSSYQSPKSESPSNRSPQLAPTAAKNFEPPKPLEVNSTPPVFQRREPAQTAPRTAAPEKRDNLTAMRELANLSAQSALKRYSRRVLVGSLYSKMVVSLVALATAISLFWMWRAVTGLNLTFYAALAALFVAIYWGVEYARITGRLAINKSGHIEWHFQPDKTAAAKNDTSSDDTSKPESPAPNPQSPL